MNKALATFMGLAATAVIIVALIFVNGFDLLHSEADYYGTKIEQQRVSLDR